METKGNYIIKNAIHDTKSLLLTYILIIATGDTKRRAAYG